MQRDKNLSIIEHLDEPWDVIVIGGGATGLGVAVEAASRNYRTLLLEQSDFAKGTSSRSTKLIHGGVRYLKQGNIKLVLEALRERGLLLQNAPHLVSNQSFIVPSYDWWSGPFYGAGLKMYDMMAGKLGLGPSELLSKEETLERLPTLEPDGLRGGVIYQDGQFDDARLALNLAQTVDDMGGVVLNYMKVTGLMERDQLIRGVKVVDHETGKEYVLEANVVVNATGVFTDEIIQMDNRDAGTLVQPSQGIHIILDTSFLPGDSAIMIPQTDDGRVLFAVPWQDRVILGTTDTPVDQPSLEPRAREEEIDFLLDHAADYLVKDPEREDVLSVFAGLRPLIKKEDTEETSQLSRDHTLIVSPTGLVTITGGKWTTYRKMAEETVDQAMLVGYLPERDSNSQHLKIHGWEKDPDPKDPLARFGTDRHTLRKWINQEPELGEKIHKRLPYLNVEVRWAVRQEMARTIEDVLSRRTRALLLDARASIEAAETVANLMAKERGWSRKDRKKALQNYRELAEGYLP